MSQIPSHRNSQNERNERRANWKTEMRRAMNAKTETTKEAAQKRFEKTAAALVANGAVTVEGNFFKVRTTGTKFYPVCKIRGVFVCACNDDEKFGVCGHRLAAEMFAAQAEAETEKQTKIAAARQAITNVIQFPKQRLRFTARLEYKSRSGFWDCQKVAAFSAKAAAVAWLKREAVGKPQPSGTVKDNFDGAVYEIADEHFNQDWQEAA